MLRFRTFGTIDLRRSGGERLSALLDQPKRLALLAFLAAHQHEGPVRREKVISVLWPDSSPASARSALSTTLSRLRDTLGEEVVRGRGEESIGLSTQRFRSDVVEFEAALTEERVEAAVELYRGPFLDGFRPRGSRSFEAWLDRHRTRYRERAYRAALEGAASRGAADDPGQAEALLRRAWEIEPLREEAVGRLMELLVTRGAPASALRVYQKFSDRLKDELGLEPPERLAALAQEARTGSSARTEGSRVTARSRGDDGRPAEDPESGGAKSASPDRSRSFRSKGNPRGYLYAVLAGVLLLAAAGWLILGGEASERFEDGPVGTDPGAEAPIAVVPFQVSGGAKETWRDGMVTLLTTALDGAAGVRPVSDRTILSAWEADRTGGSGGSRAEALSLARQMGASYAVVGSAVAIGGEIRFSAGVHDSRSGDRLGRVEVRGLRDSVPVLADELARRIVGLLAEETDSGIASTETAAVTTRSLEALEAYLAGERHYRRGDFDAAIQDYRRAVERDTAFALACWRLASSLSWSGRQGVFRLLQRARAMDARLPRRERRLLRASWLLRHQGRPVAAVDTLRRLASAYPDDPTVWYELGDAILHAGIPGGWPEADEAFQEAAELDPAHEVYQIHHLQLAIAFHHDQALAAARSEPLAGVDGPRPWFQMATTLAFGSRERRRTALTRLDTLDDPGDLRLGLAQTSLLHPRDGEAETELLRAFRADSLYSIVLFQNLLRRGRIDEAIASVQGDPQSPAVGCGLVEAASLGYPLPDSLIRSRLEPVDRTSEPSMSRLLCRGVLLADRGPEEELEDLLDRMETALSRLPNEPPGRRIRAGRAIEVLRGYRAWRHGDLDAAARRLSGSVWVDRPHNLVSSWRSLWRGDVHRERGDPDEAEGWYLAAWWHPVAHERLGRLYEQTDRPEKAVAAYRRFIAAWEGADEELQPRVDAARERLAALTSDQHGVGS